MGKVNWSDHLVNIISVILGVTLAFVFDDIASSNFAKAEKKAPCFHLFIYNLTTLPMNLV